jgi:hypothetical protein
VARVAHYQWVAADDAPPPPKPRKLAHVAQAATYRLIGNLETLPLQLGYNANYTGQIKPLIFTQQTYPYVIKSYKILLLHLVALRFLVCGLGGNLGDVVLLVGKG